MRAPWAEVIHGAGCHGVTAGHRGLRPVRGLILDVETHAGVRPLGVGGLLLIAGVAHAHVTKSTKSYLMISLIEGSMVR